MSLTEMMKLQINTRLSRFLALVALTGTVLLSALSQPARAEFSLPGFGNNNANQFVAVNDAFPFNFSQQGEVVYLDWQIKPGYYLYQHQLSVSSDNASLGQITLPAGQPYQDEFFRRRLHLYRTTDGQRTCHRGWR